MRRLKPTALLFATATLVATTAFAQRYPGPRDPYGRGPYSDPYYRDSYGNRGYGDPVNRADPEPAPGGLDEPLRQP